MIDDSHGENIDAAQLLATVIDDAAEIRPYAMRLSALLENCDDGSAILALTEALMDDVEEAVKCDGDMGTWMSAARVDRASDINKEAYGIRKSANEAYDIAWDMCDQTSSSEEAARQKSAIDAVEKVISIADDICDATDVYDTAVSRYVNGAGLVDSLEEFSVALKDASLPSTLSALLAGQTVQDFGTALFDGMSTEELFAMFDSCARDRALRVELSDDGFGLSKLRLRHVRIDLAPKDMERLLDVDRLTEQANENSDAIYARSRLDGLGGREDFVRMCVLNGLLDSAADDPAVGLRTFVERKIHPLLSEHSCVQLSRQLELDMGLRRPEVEMCCWRYRGGHLVKLFGYVYYNSLSNGTAGSY